MRLDRLQVRGTANEVVVARAEWAAAPSRSAGSRREAGPTTRHPLRLSEPSEALLAVVAEGQPPAEKRSHLRRRGSGEKDLATVGERTNSDSTLDVGADKIAVTLRRCRCGQRPDPQVAPGRPRSVLIERSMSAAARTASITASNVQNNESPSPAALHEQAAMSGDRLADESLVAYDSLSHRRRSRVPLRTEFSMSVKQDHESALLVLRSSARGGLSVEGLGVAQDGRLKCLQRRGRIDANSSRRTAR